MPPKEPTAEHAAEASDSAPPPIVDWRFGLRIFRARYYLNVRLGQERRSSQRLEEEGQVRLPVVATAYLSVFSVFFWLFGIVCSLYLLKSLAGINLFTHNSLLHPIYAFFFE